MNDLVPSWGHVYLGSLAGAALGAAAFFAIEPLMPPQAKADSWGCHTAAVNPGTEAMNGPLIPIETALKTL